MDDQQIMELTSQWLKGKGESESWTQADLSGNVESLITTGVTLMASLIREFETMAITRREALAAVSGAVTTVMSATWKRRTDKKVNRCPNCEAQVARHAGAWICPVHGEVTPYQSLDARKGDVVTMQFIPKINPNGTKNWTPNGGQCFGVATREQADAIKRRRGLVGVLKMSEKGTGDLRGEPRTIPVFDLDTLTFEGQTHTIVG